MAQRNNLSAALEPAAKDAALTSLNSFKQQLSHVLLFNLSAEDRREMLKMGDKTLAFVEKALDYAEKNPAFVPVFLDLAEAQKDLRLTADLAQLLREVNSIRQKLEDAMMVAGSEAYEAALIFHGSVKAASRSNAGASKIIYADLVQRFPGRKSLTAEKITL